MGRKRQADDVIVSFAKTRKVSIKGRHVWNIDNYVQRVSKAEPGGTLRSDRFTVGGTSFYAVLYPKENYQYMPSPFIGLFLRQFDDFGIHNEIIFSMSIQKPDGTPWARHESKLPYKQGWKHFAVKRSIEEKASLIMPEDILTIVVDIELLLDNENASSKFRKFDLPSIADDIGQCFNQEDNSDVSILCGDRKFHCHKFILRLRSNVFAAMFAHETTENKNKEVSIKDIDPDILEHLLKFVYTDSVDEEEIKPMAVELFEAADKYNLPKLKKFSEDAILESLDASNAARILLLGYLHESADLQRFSADKIAKEMDEVEKTRDWEMIEKHHPKAMKMVIEAFKKMTRK